MQTYTAHNDKVGQAIAYLAQHDGDGQAARHAADQNGDNINSAQWNEAERQHAQSTRRTAAVALGSIKSPKKAKSSRENGKKGGRPKKQP